MLFLFFFINKYICFTYLQERMLNGQNENSKYIYSQTEILSGWGKNSISTIVPKGYGSMRLLTPLHRYNYYTINISGRVLNEDGGISVFLLLDR